MSDVDDAIGAARASWSRISGSDDGLFAASPRRQKRTQAIGKRLTRIVLADAAILLAAIVIGMVKPLGVMGALFVMIALVATTIFLAAWPPETRAAPPPEKLRTVDLRALPAQTGRWLGAQRDNLPAQARGVVDRIGTRLEILSPQLGRVDQETETAHEVRRLIGEQLPAFVNDYAKVPATLRATPRNGRSPDTELVDGLALIEREIAEMTERLAQTDLDSLATRGRFLEMKYKDGDER